MSLYALNRLIRSSNLSKADTDELGLVEGETIINIEQVDEGWWTGMSEDGTRQGLFPGKLPLLQ
jgi:hypothetical protein